MQMVERPWGITAYGAASVKAVPDFVRVRFKIVRLEQAPAAAFIAQAVNQTLQLFNTRGHGDRFLPVLPGLIAELNGAKIRDL